MQRRFLFLQGTMSPFFRRVGEEVARRGAGVWRINFCPGDWIFWRGPDTVHFRGRHDQFEDFVTRFIDDKKITDIVYFGDSRAYHRTASIVARRRGLRIHAIEFGYLRPNWLTLEPDGMSSLSRFPSEPDAIRALAADKPAPPASVVSPGNFRQEVINDLTYNLSNSFIGPFTHRHYKRPGVYHPLHEYAGWVMRFCAKPFEKRRTAATLRWLEAEKPRYFLFPLQLATDFQIRTHSPFGTIWKAVEWTVRSFARNAPADTHLLLKVHPLDNGLIRWRKRLMQLAETEKVPGRIHFVDGGDLGTHVRQSEGVITINSTTGIYALKTGRPVIVLGSAVYDVPGITHQGPLSTFWTAPEAAEKELFSDFIRALAWATQLHGGVLTPPMIELGAKNLAERMLEPTERLHPKPGVKPRQRPFKRAEEWRNDVGDGVT